MSTVIREVFIDDLDGSSPAGPVRFSYAGRSYTIDLHPDNAARLSDTLAPFIAAARPLAPAARKPRRG